MNPVYAYCNRHLSVAHCWGQADCLTFAADWVREMHGVDPAADLRMTYASFGECQRVTGFFTNPLGVVRPRLQALGFAETTRPRQGDVGILLQLVTPSITRPFGAICLGAQWACLSDQGLTLLIPQKVVAAWDMRFSEMDPAMKVLDHA